MYGGRQLRDTKAISEYGIGRDSTLYLVLRLLGGKGGFGALLRSGARGSKTENFDACRDLSGRRLRHVNADKQLAGESHFYCFPPSLLCLSCNELVSNGSCSPDLARDIFTRRQPPFTINIDCTTYFMSRTEGMKHAPRIVVAAHSLPTGHSPPELNSKRTAKTNRLIAVNCICNRASRHLKHFGYKNVPAQTSLRGNLSSPTKKK